MSSSRYYDGDTILCQEISVTLVKARKERHCDFCRELIAKGQSYYRVFSIVDGDPVVTKGCSPHGECIP